MTTESNPRPIIFLDQPKPDMGPVPAELREWEAAVVRFANLRMKADDGGSCAFTVCDGEPCDSKVDYTFA
ncbi:hypothetical protein SLA_1093 [Streptomyces laurentii]|uniref:Uncharacterized protein n=1 Tax=Streptomyces laurentii TaxID=39478 RepID=A0A160NVT9_STRLU|nr:hypothetical protein SLA_1093 [Streptomyces laurentii]